MTTIFAIAAIVVVLFAMRQSIRAQQRDEREDEFRRHVRRAYGGGK